MDKQHEVALWAGVAACCGTVLAVGAIDVLNVDGRAQFFSSIVVGVFTGVTVYSRERLKFARQRKNGDP